MHAGIQLQQTIDRGKGGDLPGVGPHHPAEQAQKGRLARAVSPDHPHNLARRNREIHIMQRPERRPAARAKTAGNPGAEGGGGGGAAVMEPLPQPGNGQRCARRAGHISSRNPSRARRK